MSDAKLMMPLFCNGMFNCGGRRIRAVHLYDVSDGEHRYRLWTKAGTPDIDYPRGESDRYLLYVEIHGYLAPQPKSGEVQSSSQPLYPTAALVGYKIALFRRKCKGFWEKSSPNRAKI